MMEIAASSFAVDNGMKSRLQALARQILDEQNRRQRYFPRVLFDEVPWQMLLVLYVSETSRLSSDSLMRSALAPAATGSRWIDYLAAEGLVTRRAEPSNKARSMVELAPKGICLMELYLKDRLQRGELGTGARQSEARSRRSGTPLALVVLAAAALSAGMTYLVTSFRTVARVLDWN